MCTGLSQQMFGVSVDPEAARGSSGQSKSEVKAVPRTTVMSTQKLLQSRYYNCHPM